jgi:YidC/Oxa1 family membrane protein insertase
MAEPTPPNPLKPPKNDLQMELRLLALFVSMGLILFVWQYFFKPPAPPVETPKQQQAKETKAPPPTEPAKPAPAALKAAAVPSEVKGTAEELVSVDTGVAKILISSKGAVVKSWVLTRYQDAAGKPLEVVNSFGAGKVPPPFWIEYNGQTPVTDVNQALYAVKKSADGLQLEFEFSDGQVSAKKTFAFARDSYITQVTSEVQTGGRLLAHNLAWRGGFGDATVHNYFDILHATYFDAVNDKAERKLPGDVKDGPVSVTGSFPFAGLDDAYFAAAFLPQAGTIHVTNYADSILVPSENKEKLHMGVAVGGLDGLNQFRVFVGPKDTGLLGRVHPKLDRLIDWSDWFGFIARPLFLVLKWTHDTITKNWGWAIVLVTVGINLALLPLKFSSLKSAKKMQGLQPEIQKINDKYKNISMRDPRKAEQNQEIMELYKKHGVNPLGGCLPMVMQIPFFFAFYRVLSVAIELRGAEWLWVADLSRPEAMAIRILPVVMLVTQLIMQKMTPASPGMDPTQQKMMMVMPLALGFVFWYASSGLVLYWLTGNLVGIAQQWVTNRIGSSPKPAPQQVIDVKPQPAKKKK